MRRLTILMVALVLVAAAGIGFAETEIETAPLTWKQAARNDGQTLYGELCAACHGVSGKGDGPAAPALASGLPDLTQLAILNGGEFPADRVQRAIEGEVPITAHGTIEMPVWGRALTDVRPDYKPGQRWAFARMRVYSLTEYLRTLQSE